MRVLVLKVPCEDVPKGPWMVAYVLPFAPVAATRFGGYGLLGDFVELHLANDLNERQTRAQVVFENYVEKVAKEKVYAVERFYMTQADITKWCARGVTLSWVTDHKQKGE